MEAFPFIFFTYHKRTANNIQNFPQKGHFFQGLPKEVQVKKVLGETRGCSPNLAIFNTSHTGTFVLFSFLWWKDLGALMVAHLDIQGVHSGLAVPGHSRVPPAVTTPLHYTWIAGKVLLSFFSSFYNHRKGKKMKLLWKPQCFQWGWMILFGLWWSMGYPWEKLGLLFQPQILNHPRIYHPGRSKPVCGNCKYFKSSKGFCSLWEVHCSLCDLFLSRSMYVGVYRHMCPCICG